MAAHLSDDGQVGGNAQCTELLSNLAADAQGQSYRPLQDQPTGCAELQGNGSPAAVARPSGSDARSWNMQPHVLG